VTLAVAYVRLDRSVHQDGRRAGSEDLRTARGFGGYRRAHGLARCARG
jgi:hypothetical protein